MFERKLLKNNRIDFKKILFRYNKIVDTYTDKDGKVVNENGFCIYLNINPTDLIKTYYAFTDKMNTLLQQITIETMEGKIADRLIVEFNTLESNLHTAMQKSRLHKNLIDIDVDDKEKGVQEELHKEYSGKKVKHLCIETHGGFHFLLVRSTLSYDFNTSLEYFSKLIEKEVCVNKNEMVPLPGTYQGGYPVKIRYDLSCIEENL
jgi:hypothetical protein